MGNLWAILWSWTIRGPSVISLYIYSLSLSLVFIQAPFSDVDSLGHLLVDCVDEVVLDKLGAQLCVYISVGINRNDAHNVGLKMIKTNKIGSLSKPQFTLVLCGYRERKKEKEVEQKRLSELHWCCRLSARSNFPGRCRLPGDTHISVRNNNDTNCADWTPPHTPAHPPIHPPTFHPPHPHAARPCPFAHPPPTTHTHIRPPFTHARSHMLAYTPTHQPTHPPTYPPSLPSTCPPIEQQIRPQENTDMCVCVCVTNVSWAMDVGDIHVVHHVDDAPVGCEPTPQTQSQCGVNRLPIHITQKPFGGNVFSRLEMQYIYIITNFYVLTQTEKQNSPILSCVRILMQHGILFWDSLMDTKRESSVGGCMRNLGTGRIFMFKCCIV